MGCNDSQLAGITKQDMQTEPSGPDPVRLWPVASGNFVFPATELICLWLEEIIRFEADDLKSSSPSDIVALTVQRDPGSCWAVSNSQTTQFLAPL